MELKKSQTIKNMARAFAGECQAGARYQFLRKQATQKQMPYLAGVLKLLATNEMAHAKVLFDKIVGCSKKIIENIEITAGYPFKCGAFDKRFEMEMENERSEAESIYPSFAVKAREEGFEDIAELFDMIGEVEKKHTKIFAQIVKKMRDGTLYASQKPVKWKCSMCGYEHSSTEAWKTCPLCGAPQGAAEIQLDM